jgi:hypothetical protein
MPYWLDSHVLYPISPMPLVRPLLRRSGSPGRSCAPESRRRSRSATRRPACAPSRWDHIAPASAPPPPPHNCCCQRPAYSQRRAPKSAYEGSNGRGFPGIARWCDQENGDRFRSAAPGRGFRPRKSARARARNAGCRWSPPSIAPSARQRSSFPIAPRAAVRRRGCRRCESSPAPSPPSLSAPARAPGR